MRGHRRFKPYTLKSLVSSALLLGLLALQPISALAANGSHAHSALENQQAVDQSAAASLSDGSAGQSPQNEEASPAASASDSPSLSGSVYQTDYVLGAGDLIYLEDANMGLLVKEGKIVSDGSMSLPLVGKIQVGGLTVKQAKALLTEKYAKYYVDPRLTFQVTSQRPVRVYVTGAVARPGVYVSGKNLSDENIKTVELGNYDSIFSYYRLYLADALLQAGGLNFNADARDIRIHRNGQEQPVTVHVNLMDLFAHGNLLQDIPLRDQDVIEVAELPASAIVMDQQWEEFARNSVAQGEFKVSVLGAVRKPGAYPMQNRDNILGAIAKAGGFSEMANKNRIYVLRTTASGQVVKRELNLDDRALVGKKPFQTWAALLPNDVVFVDESTGMKGEKAAAGLVGRTSTAALYPIFNRLFTSIIPK